MMKSLKDLLRSDKLNTPILRGVRAAAVIEHADRALEELFGKEIKKFAAAGYYSNGVLTIACLSSVTAQEIRMNEAAFLEKLNSLTGGIKISKVRYLT